MAKTIRIVHNEMDREVTVFVGDKEVGHADYDMHAWAGLELIENVAEGIGKALGVEVVHDDAEFDADGDPIFEDED